MANPSASSGKRNCRVTITKRGPEVDEIGQPIDAAPVVVARPWANIRHLNGTETIKAGAETSIVKASIRILYRHGIDAGMQVTHKTTTYQIEAVLPDETDRKFIDLACKVVS